MMTMLLMLPVMMVMPVKKVMKYIYYDGVSVCLCVTKNHHFRVECQRREARRRRGLGAVGRLWPSDDDDDVDDVVDDDDDDNDLQQEMMRAQFPKIPTVATIPYIT